MRRFLNKYNEISIENNEYKNQINESNENIEQIEIELDNAKETYDKETAKYNKYKEVID